MTTRATKSALLRNAWVAARRLAARSGKAPREHFNGCLADEWQWFAMIGYVTLKPVRRNMSAMQAALLAIDEMNARHKAEGITGFLVGGANRIDPSERAWREAYRVAA
jgi:hypothetical protein